MESEISSMYILPDASVIHDFEMAFSCESSFDQIRFFTVIRAFKSQHFQKFCFDFVLFVSKGFPESLLFFFVLLEVAPRLRVIRFVRLAFFSALSLLMDCNRTVIRQPNNPQQVLKTSSKKTENPRCGKEASASFLNFKRSGCFRLFENCGYWLVV